MIETPILSPWMMISPFATGLSLARISHRVVLAGIQLDDGAAAHAQQLVHRNGRTAEDDGDFDFDAGDVRGHEGPHG